MKVKLLNVLTVCLIIFVVLSPGIVVFSIVWGRHLELIKTQNSACELNKAIADDAVLIPQTTSTNLSQCQTSTKISDRNVVNTLQYKLAAILQWFVLITPIFVGLGIIVYDRYLVYRAAILKEQVEMLERVWQRSIE